ncbi:MAG: hypothetical protein EOP88_17960 [Verrucomicrobiaceae bacterium]|nr:MAG: hypothetical protein EOP88_17960 [Verrucomicrobiaceae bacterium]
MGKGEAPEGKMVKLSQFMGRDSLYFRRGDPNGGACGTTDSDYANSFNRSHRRPHPPTSGRIFLIRNGVNLLLKTHETSLLATCSGFPGVILIVRFSKTPLDTLPVMTTHSCPARTSGFLIRVLGGAAALLMASGAFLQASPGLDAPAAIGPYLNGAFPKTEPTGASEWTVQETYNGININLPMHIAPYPGTNKLLCVAKEGRIFLFEDNAAATQTETFLDLRSQTFTSSDSGMTWLVFHPQFGQAGSPNRGYVYVTYKWKPSGGNGSEAYWRLVRFTVQDGTQVADPASEQILIQQYDRQQFHDAGCMMFGSDGYLYLSIGDEGGANDEYNVTQKINERLFSGILRIDVDQKPTSHDIRRQPAQRTMPAGWPNSYTANYKIPSDNPFNDAGGANLEEFYAIGLRQPYRFSQDPVTHLIWIAESGQDTREELDILTPGANYGWPFREGKIPRPTGPQPPVVPSPIIGTLKEPIWDVAHGIDNCIIGGFVYRGTENPSLVGKYITADNVTSHVRAHSYDGTVATNEILTDMPSGSVYSGTSTIGWDADGEPIFIKINGTGTRGRYFKLSTIPANTTRAGWYRFDDQPVANTSGYVSDNPGNSTVNSVARGLPLLANDDESSASSNVLYVPSNGLNPTGFAPNTAGVRMAAGDGNGRPGNQPGELYTSSKLGVLNDFTVELSFQPNTGSLGGGYQCFMGLHGTTGTAPGDGEAGPPLQPFRLMRWGRNDATATTIPLENGDLYLNVRTLNPTTSAWTSVPIQVVDKNDFTVNKWYHLAIVGSVSEGTVKVYSYNSTTSAYTLVGQGSGYVGNLQSGVWTVGRGTYNGGAADYVTSADFDEVRISDTALPVEKFLYGSQPFIPEIPVTEPPQTLSETGAFSNTPGMVPVQGMVPYGVNAPLWSDAAAKMRWMALPNNGTHDTAAEKITFAPEGNWTFPKGTVFVKHFELPVDDANPAIHRRLETRFVIVPETGEPYGVTYKWRPDGSDADLLPGGLNEVIDIATVGGGTRQQTWTYPSRNECKVCHNGNADYILGVKTHQLNGNFTYPLTGRTANQLETLGALGWFDTTYREDLVPWMLKSHNVAETSASLTDRVRSYLDSNCSQCHQPGGVRAYFDARYTTALDEQGLIYGELETSYGHPDNRVIVPGQPERSIMLTRLSSVAEIKMPPIAKHVVDQAAVTLMTDWINSLATGPSVAMNSPSAPSGPFTVNVHFSQEVTGLTASDFVVTNGSATGVTGSGAEYVLSVTPAGFGTVTVKLPANSAANGGGLGNYASKLFSQAFSDPAFVAWLKLDDGAGNVAVDSSPSASNNGTLVSMEAGDWTSAGRFGGALVFDNTDERVTVPNMLGSDFSVSFWMKTNQVFQVTNAPAQGISIFNADMPGNARDFIIGATRTAGGVNRISFQTGNPNTVAHGTTSVNDNQWHHVVVTRHRSSGEMKVYVNGIQEAVITGSTSILDQNPTLSIGASPGSAANSYEGSLDEIRMYTRVLSQDDVTALSQDPAGEPPYDQWVEGVLPGIYHLHGMKEDPEKDGLTNFAEFAFGSDPLAHDFIPVPFERAADGSVTVSYRVRKDPAGAAYEVFMSGNLLSWSAASVHITAISAQDIPGTDYEWKHVTLMPPAEAGNHLFFRVRAIPE